MATGALRFRRMIPFKTLFFSDVRFPRLHSLVDMIWQKTAAEKHFISEHLHFTFHGMHGLRRLLTSGLAMLDWVTNNPSMNGHGWPISGSLMMFLLHT